MQIAPTPIPGCLELLPDIRRDKRGSFVKTFHQDDFRANGLATDFAEEYYSISHNGVLRGLHFQLPPADHVKLVYCVAGAVFDAVLDLRVGSPTYGRHAALELSAEKGNSLYISKGLAHGFYTKSDVAIMIYKVTSTYAPEHDTGVLWSSAGIEWPGDAPILSPRDRRFPKAADFRSPFRFEG